VIKEQSKILQKRILACYLLYTLGNNTQTSNVLPFLNILLAIFIKKTTRYLEAN
jgi:hypothetical protein